MIYEIKTDLIPLLENLVAAIQPFAKASCVTLHFESSLDKAEIEYHPEAIIPDLTKILCRVITFTPQDYQVKLEVRQIDAAEGKFLQVQVSNTGFNLALLKEIVSDLRREVSVFPLEQGGTIFELRFPMEPQKELEEKVGLVSSFCAKKYRISPFLKKLEEHLHSHFISIPNLEKAASARSQRDGVLLKKVNAVIIANLDLEGFDSTSLSKALALSRSQLYRRLKPLIRLAPAHYIRYVRLQKAKELLEKNDLSIGEVAFRTGFMNQSHFTRAFREQFGFNPSELSQN